MNELEHIHRDWLGMAQPEGLVVTASTLAQAGANLTWPVSDLAEQIKTLCGNAKSAGDWDGFLRVWSLLRPTRPPLDSPWAIHRAIALESQDPLEHPPVAKATPLWRLLEEHS